MLYLRLEKNINNIENTGNLALIGVWQKVAFSLRSFSAEISDRVSSLKTCLHRATVSLAAMSLDKILVHQASHSKLRLKLGVTPLFLFRAVSLTFSVRLIHT